jgi:methanogenesis marker radical SAM protein
MIVHSDVWGRPGLDCGGFCEFCFYKNVDFTKLKPTGCVKCPPGVIGCDHCQGLVNRMKKDFKSLPVVYYEIRDKLMQMELWGLLGREDPELVITSGADIFYYPQLYQLVSIIKEYDLHLHFGYTGGKAIKDGMAEELILKGVDEVSYSVFSTDPQMRWRWMNDKSPEESIQGLKLFCENIDINASAIVIPGINEEEQILNTCADLENWGVKSFSLRRFANSRNQGLIFSKKTIMDDVTIQSFEEYQNLVRKVSHEFNFKVLSFPFYDQEKGFPFALSQEKNRAYMTRLPPIKRGATILTSKLAFSYIRDIFNVIDKSNQVNIIGLNKEIADLITEEDLKSVELNQLQEKIIIPQGALVHSKQAEKILSKDGKIKNIIRGPKLLTHPYYEGIEFNDDELIRYELMAFRELIKKVNQ